MSGQEHETFLNVLGTLGIRRAP